ncbi:SH3 domain-containing protein [Leptospira interrogans serovar Canicola]|uniref:SH3 domain-containing protein n=2 Tax=Leptospira interrogans TaxID=173 RepID=A0AAP9WAR5_LEPIR|nr:SH3 domain-containing protein [Leptospira interrogans serovar Canicola]
MENNMNQSKLSIFFKTILIIITLESCIDSKSKTYIVLPNEGISLHNNPDAEAEIILNIPQKTYLKLIRKDESEKIYYNNGGKVPSKWIFVDYNNQKGWVYSGYLGEQFDEGKAIPEKIIQGEWVELKAAKFQDQESIKIKAHPFEKGNFKLELNPYSGIDHFVYDKASMVCNALICSVKNDKELLFKFQVLNNYEMKILESLDSAMGGTHSEEMQTYKVLEEGRIYFKEQ